MQKIEAKSILYWLIAFSALVLSFIIYSPVYYSFLDSDMAIQILMADDFSFTDGMYYWGQNRLGSFIPLFGALLVLIGISPIWAVSLVLYSLLFGSWLLTRHFIKNSWAQIIWLLLILFQGCSFKESIMIGHPYAPQFFIFSLLLFIVSKKKDDLIKTMPIIILILGVGLWVSEMMLAVVFAFFFWIAINYKHLKILEKLRATSVFEKLKILFAFLIVGAFIIFAKQSAGNTSQYFRTFNTPQEFWEILKTIFEYIFNGLSFNAGQSADIYLTYLIVLLSCLSIFKLVKNFDLRSVESLFIIGGISSFLMLLASYWVFRNGIPVRYFSLPFWILLFIILRSISLSNQKYLLILVVLIPILSFVSITEVINRGRHFSLNRPNRVQSLEQISGKTNVTFLGDYWNSYIFEAYNPNDVYSIPHQHAFNRSLRHSKDAFSADTIIVLGRGWLPGYPDNYPDTLYQYGERLIKVDQIPGYLLDSLGVYVLSSEETLDYQYFLNSTTPAVDPLTGDKNVVLLKPTEGQDEPLLIGPMKYLKKGKYRIAFLLRKSENNPFIKLNIQAKGMIDQKLYYNRYFTFDQLPGGVYQELVFDLQLSKDECLNFNLYLGRNQGEVWFKELSIQKLDE